MSKKVLGERIRERREHLGLSQEQLARKMSYKDKSAISKIESGQRDLTQEKIRNFAEALATTTSYLMGWTDDPRDYLEILDSYGKEIPDDFLPGENTDIRAREYLRHIQIDASLLKDYVDALDEYPRSILYDAFEENSGALYRAYCKAPHAVRMAVCSLLGIEMIKTVEEEEHASV